MLVPVEQEGMARPGCREVGRSRDPSHVVHALSVTVAPAEGAQVAQRAARVQERVSVPFGSDAVPAIEVFEKPPSMSRGSVSAPPSEPMSRVPARSEMKPRRNALLPAGFDHPVTAPVVRPVALLRAPPAWRPTCRGARFPSRRSGTHARESRASSRRPRHSR